MPMLKSQLHLADSSRTFNDPITFDGDIIEDIKLDIPNMDSVTLRESGGFADDLAEFELFKDQTGYQVGGKE